MHIVVIGSGLAGLASAARLAKLGHQVTVLEQRKALGGALSQRESDGFRWDAGPSQTLLPAVLRDLFRKSGRPLEAEFELTAVEVIRAHHFADGSVAALRNGRASQLAAFDGLGPGLGAIWVDHVAAYGDVWDALRRDYLERPWQPTMASARSRAELTSRRSLAQSTRGLRDPRLRQVATHEAVMAGQDPGRTPAWCGLSVYLEQKFGAWTHHEGLGQLSTALERRLATRKVSVHTGTLVTDVIVRDGSVAGVLTDAGRVAADAVVLAASSTHLPAVAANLPRRGRLLPRRTPTAARPPHLIHLGLQGSAPAVAQVTVFHAGSGPDDPRVEVHTGGAAPKGAAVATLVVRGELAADPVTFLAERGLSLSDRITTRLEVTPQRQLEEFHGSPWGPAWSSAAGTLQRWGPNTEIPGLFAAGSYAAPGAGVPFAGLSAALVAQAIGPA